MIRLFLESLSFIPVSQKQEIYKGQLVEGRAKRNTNSVEMKAPEFHVLTATSGSVGFQLANLLATQKPFVSTHAKDIASRGRYIRIKYNNKSVFVLVKNYFRIFITNKFL